MEICSALQITRSSSTSKVLCLPCAWLRVLRVGIWRGRQLAEQALAGAVDAGVLLEGHNEGGHGAAVTSAQQLWSLGADLVLLKEICGNKPEKQAGEHLQCNLSRSRHPELRVSGPRAGPTLAQAAGL